MPTIDLTSAREPAVADLLDSLPRRVALTLPELRVVAELAGGAPLPFESVPPAATSTLDGRLGQSRRSAEDTAYADVLDSLHDPHESLERRGLIGDDRLLGAVGLLATPRTAVDLDVAVAGIHARAWHRRAGDAVATLSTVDGIVFEVAWLDAPKWAGELTRAATLPGDVGLRASEVPAHLDLPYDLLDSAAEAIRGGRSDLVPVLAARKDAPVHDGDGVTVAEPEVTRILSALATEPRGRLRALVADVSGTETTVVGVVSWTLLADGWHALRPHTGADHHRVQVVHVQPDALATELAPVLAAVTA